MNRERDTAAAVRAWLREDARDNADRVLDAVLAQLDATPQRRSRWVAAGFPTMNRSWLAYGFAALSLAAAAIIGLNLVSDRVASPPTPAPTAAPTPVTPPPPRLSAGGPLFGGRYTLAGALGITVEAPANGWTGRCCPGDPAIFNDADGPAPYAAFRFADATQIIVYNNPCDWAHSVTQEPSGAAAIAAALSALPGRSGSEPEQVSLAGTTAVHVRLKVPGKADFGSCYGHLYRTWNTLAGDSRDQEGPGQIDDIYLVDIGAKTVLFDLGYFPETSKSDRRALTAMLESIRISPPFSP